ncbi:glycine zipper family protein [Methylobacter psychrophilus]|uniref:glycine zipper family protein n=1 Tax=Methylobacter psychrophilus TaxID=96941 RepID=UPI0021D4F7D0|nr:glycine zipper family protein [Methylobacter psychrophilus]
MKKYNLPIILVVSALATGCASMSGWRPILDPRMDEHPETVQRDMAECKTLADQASDITKEVAMGAGVGAVTGAAGGAAIGAIAGSAATGAAGGAILAIPVGLWKGYEANEDFKRAFRTCMRQRDHKLVN